MNREKNQNDYIYWRLGQLGIEFEEIRKLMDQAMSASVGHGTGVAPVEGTPLVIAVAYNPGIDGYDSWYSLQEAHKDAFPYKIEDAVEMQARMNLGTAHLVYINHTGFVLAHKDAERASGTDLHDCAIHQWLTADENSYGSLTCCFEANGWYEITDLHEVRRISP